MARVTPEEFVEKWGRRTKAAVADFQKGVRRVKEHPGKAAARQQDVLLANLTQAIVSGHWARRVSAGTLEDWQTKTADKGGQRIAAGVDGAMPGMASTAQKLLANVDATLAEVNQTPRGDLETNLQRMVNFARGMAARKVKQ